MASSREEIKSLVDDITDAITSQHKFNLLGRCSCRFSSRSVEKIQEHFMSAVVDELVARGVTVS